MRNLTRELKRMAKINTSFSKRCVSPDTITSMKRTVRVISGGSELAYEVVIVVRDHPELKRILRDTEKYTKLLYGAARDVFDNWLEIALDYWDGALTPRVLRKCNIPAKFAGDHVVTVYGNIVDRLGRCQSLTLTDQSDTEEAYRRLTETDSLFDHVSERSARGNENPFGVGGYNTKVINAARPTVEEQVVKVETGKFCETMTELRGLAEGEEFRLRIGKVSLRSTKGEQCLLFYGYNIGANGKLVLDERESVFYYSSRDGFASLIEGIKTKKGLSDLGDGFSSEIEGGMILRGKKMVSKEKKTAYYVNLAWDE